MRAPAVAVTSNRGAARQRAPPPVRNAGTSPSTENNDVAGNKCDDVRCTPNSSSRNLRVLHIADRIIAALDEARAAGAQLMLTPELALSGYPPEDLLLRADFYRACAREV